MSSCCTVATTNLDHPSLSICRQVHSRVLHTGSLRGASGRVPGKNTQMHFRNTRAAMLFTAQRPHGSVCHRRGFARTTTCSTCRPSVSKVQHVHGIPILKQYDNIQNSWNGCNACCTQGVYSLVKSACYAEKLIVDWLLMMGLFFCQINVLLL